MSSALLDDENARADEPADAASMGKILDGTADDGPATLNIKLAAATGVRDSGLIVGPPSV